MDFRLTETQQAVAGLAAQILVLGSEPKAGPRKELAQVGLLAVGAVDGDGLGVPETATLLTELGRRAVPGPALATLMTGALPIARWGSEDLRRQLLPQVASGGLLLTPAIREPSTPFPETPGTTLTPSGLTGTKLGVPYAAEAARQIRQELSAIMESPSWTPPQAG